MAKDIVNNKENVHGKQSHDSESLWDRVRLCISTTGTSWSHYIASSKTIS